MRDAGASPMSVHALMRKLFRKSSGDTSGMKVVLVKAVRAASAKESAFLREVGKVLSLRMKRHKKPSICFIDCSI